MTSRHLAEVAIKILGVYFGASAFLAAIQFLASFAMPPMEGFPPASAFAFGLPIVGWLIISAVCLYGAAGIAARVFPESKIDVVPRSRRDLLLVGLILLGVWTALDGIPELLQLVGKAVWYAEASRQDLFRPTIERSWEPFLKSTLTVIVGAALAKSAGTLAAKLDRGES